MRYHTNNCVEKTQLGEHLKIKIIIIMIIWLIEAVDAYQKEIKMYRAGLVPGRRPFVVEFSFLNWRNCVGGNLSAQM